ncbi:MAG: NAD-dependent epimerase/dehydratase family protein [Anaerolineae bacterium]
MSKHFLVTGALGCIGSWVVRRLVRAGIEVTAYDLATDPYRLRLIMTPVEVDEVNFARGDITDLEALISLGETAGITDIIHLAALQVPACKADPALGARVNVVGTINVFEAALRLGIERVVYASSVAVYGTKEDYESDLIQRDDPLNPRTLCGAYKQANETTARVYWWDYGLTTIGLRPYVIYGPGRDQGMTSTATKAMLAAAAGLPYHISYGGRCGMQYADDVGRLFVEAAQVPFKGADVFNIQGSVVDMTEVVGAIEGAVPAVQGQITFEPTPLPFPAGQNDARLRELLGSVRYTPLKEGVATTIDTFRAALAAGRITL